MYKNTCMLQPNRKTTNKRIKSKDLLRLRLYAMELNKLIVSPLSTTRQKKL